AEAGDDRGHVPRARLAHEPVARDHLELKLPCQLVGALGRRGARDHGPPPADDAVAVGLQTERELLRAGVRPAWDDERASLHCESPFSLGTEKRRNARRTYA